MAQRRRSRVLPRPCAQGFLPEEVDAWVQADLYPSYSPQLLLFLGLSSLYGLFKTGKLPGQPQQPQK